jgi:hypothetical protein
MSKHFSEKNVQMSKVLTWVCQEKGCGKVIQSLDKTQLDQNVSVHKLIHEPKKEE